MEKNAMKVIEEIKQSDNVVLTMSGYLERFSEKTEKIKEEDKKALFAKYKAVMGRELDLTNINIEENLVLQLSAMELHLKTNMYSFLTEHDEYELLALILFFSNRVYLQEFSIIGLKLDNLNGLIDSIESLLTLNYSSKNYKDFLKEVKSLIEAKVMQFTAEEEAKTDVKSFKAEDYYGALIGRSEEKENKDIDEMKIIYNGITVESSDDKDEKGLVDKAKDLFNSNTYVRYSTYGLLAGLVVGGGIRLYNEFKDNDVEELVFVNDSTIDKDIDNLQNEISMYL